MRNKNIDSTVQYLQHIDLDIDISLSFKDLFICFQRGGWEGEREREKHHASHMPPMCPAWELNQQPFGLQAGTQSTDPHQPGLDISLCTDISEGK